MYEIVTKKVLNPTVIQMDIKAPFVAKKAQAGQFIILRVDEEGERIPLTVADTDPEAGTVRIIFQRVGATTDKLAVKEAGESISDFAGPLGRPTETEGLKKVEFKEVASEDELELDTFYVDGNSVHFIWQNINDAETTMPIKTASLVAGSGLAVLIGLFLAILAISIFAMMGLGLIIIIL